MNNSQLLTKILREELNSVTTTPIFVQQEFNRRLQVARQNLSEAKVGNFRYNVFLAEYFAQSNITDPKFRPTKPWTNVKAENLLKRLGAKPYRLGINPHGYELDTTNDRLWFYYDGEVYSTNQNRELGYEVSASGNEIELWNKPGSKSSKSGFKIGTIKNVGGKPTFISSAENLEKGSEDTSAETPEESSSGWDTFQTILDWAGLIPVIGDALDVINAIIYFIRGKWVDGLLSVIAVVPIVGSGIKLSIKSIYKGLKLEKLIDLIVTSIKTNKTDNLWRELMTSGAITKEQLNKLGPGLDELSRVLQASYPGIKKIPNTLINSNDIIKQLDNFAEWLKNSSKSIDDITGAAKRAGEKQLYKSAESISTNVGFLRRFGNVLSGNILPKLKRAPFWPEKKIKQIALGLEKRFARDMMADSTKLTSLIKLSPNQNTLMRRLQADMMSRFKALPSDQKSAFVRQLNTMGLISGNKINIRSANDWSKFLNIASSSSATRGMYDSISQQIVNHAKRNDSIIWNLYKTDRLNNLKTILSKDMIPDGSNIFKEMDFSFRKNVDIIWNELQDVAESLGIKEKDDVNGVLWPAITYGVSEYLPGVYDAGKTVQSWVKSAVESPAGSAAWETAKQSVGLDSKEDAAYNPEAEKGGDFK